MFFSFWNYAYIVPSRPFVQALMSELKIMMHIGKHLNIGKPKYSKNIKKNILKSWVIKTLLSNKREQFEK